MSSHALLLRLFLSSSFFSVHVALKYLLLYSDNIGITYYLTRRLKELDIDELRDVWGFICHLLVTRPSKSRAIECFVTDTAEHSTHIALITFWFMQSTLTDLSATLHSPSFLICQRVLHKCHDIIFSTADQSHPSPYSGFVLPALIKRKKIKHHVEPALLGLGMILAGAPCMPALTDVMGHVAVEQGRAEEEGEGHAMRSLEIDLRDSYYTQTDSPTRISDDLSALLSRRQTFGAQTLPALPLRHTPKHKARLSDDPLGQLDFDQDSQRSRSQPYASTPSLPSPSLSSPRTQDVLLERYDPTTQMRLLRGNYLVSEVQFILALENICNTLVVLPKPARVSALRAELTALNHKLPAEVCMPMWCPSSDQPLPSSPSPSTPKLTPHHRIVRIPPGEAVVLNSAERAPFLLYIEILNGDLDFDPGRRVNRGVLGGLVGGGMGGRGAFGGGGGGVGTAGDGVFDAIRTPMTAVPVPDTATASSSSYFLTEPYSAFSYPSHRSYASSRSSPMSNEEAEADAEAEAEEDKEEDKDKDEEEIDLVEQVFGTGTGNDQPLRSRMQAIEEAMAGVGPVTPKNREWDMVAWARASPLGAFSGVGVDPLRVGMGMGSPGTGHARDRRTLSVTPALESRRTSMSVEVEVGTLPTTTTTTATTSGWPGDVLGTPDTTMGMRDRDRDISLDEYSERMRTAAIMLAQLNADQTRGRGVGRDVGGLHLSLSLSLNGGGGSGSGYTRADGVERSRSFDSTHTHAHAQTRPILSRADASLIRERIMQEMNALEEERMARMRGRGRGDERDVARTSDRVRVSERDGDRDISRQTGDMMMRTSSTASGSTKSAEDEGIIRRELDRDDPSAVVFSEGWSGKKSRIRQASPYGHLANWDCVSVIVKTGGDLRQEQLAVQLIHEFQRVWAEEKCACWVKYFRIMITGASSGLVETITDAVSIHSIKKAEYAKRLAAGKFGHVTLLDHFISTYGDPASAKFIRAQKNFVKSLAGYSLITFLLQIKDRHNGNILLDRDGHLVHIDFGFMLSNTPGNMGFEAAPFKLPSEYVEVLGGIEGSAFGEFRRLFREGFEAARKHCDRVITLVELMQKDSTFPCFALSGDQTATQLRARFQPTLTHSLIGDYCNSLIDSSLGSHWTRLYDSYQYYSQSIL